METRSSNISELEAKRKKEGDARIALDVAIARVGVSWHERNLEIAIKQLQKALGLI